MLKEDSRLFTIENSIKSIYSYIVFDTLGCTPYAMEGYNEE